MEDNLDKLSEELRAILKKYPKVTAMVIASDHENGSYMVAGDHCEICAYNMLVMHLTENHINTHDNDSCEATPSGKVH